jgi:hypothetical protein
MLHILKDPGIEELIPLTSVPSMGVPFVPTRQSGRRIAASTIYRWATRGCRGVKLEVLRTGGVTCTTRAALLRFYEGVTRMSMGAEIPAPPPPAHRILADVDRELDLIFEAKKTQGDGG